MFTGTLIRDLMATVERAEQSVQRKRIVDEMELQRMFSLQVPVMIAEQGSTQVYAGAA